MGQVSLRWVGVFQGSRNGITGGILAASRALRPGVIKILVTLRVSLQATGHRVAAEREFVHHLLLGCSWLEAELLLASFTFPLPAATV